MTGIRPICRLQEFAYKSSVCALYGVTVSGMASAILEQPSSSSMAFGATCGILSPYIYHIWICTLKGDCPRRQESRSLVSVTAFIGAYLTSAFVATLVTQRLFKQFSYNEALLLSATNLGTTAVLTGIVTIGSLCLMTQYLHVISRRNFHQDTSMV